MDRVVSTNKHNSADPIYWTFMQRYYMFRRYTSAVISLCHAYSIATGYLLDDS